MKFHIQISRYSTFEKNVWKDKLLIDRSTKNKNNQKNSKITEFYLFELEIFYFNNIFSIEWPKKIIYKKLRYKKSPF